MSDTLMGTLVGSAVTLLLGVLTWYTGVRVNRAKEREQEKTADAAEQSRVQSVEEKLWKRMESKLAEQDKKIEDLTKRLDFKDKQLGEQSREIRDLQDREQDREELLADYREHTLAHQLWLDDGGDPPIPKRSWRIRMDLEREQHEKR